MAGKDPKKTRAKSISQMTPQQRKVFQKFKTKKEDEKVSAMGGYKSGGRAGYKLGGPITPKDINKNGKKDSFEIARAKGMAKGMGRKFQAKKGGRA